MPESTSKPPADAVFRRSGRCASPRRTLPTAETRLTAVQSGHCGPVSSDVRHSGTHLHGFRLKITFVKHVTADGRKGFAPYFESKGPNMVEDSRGLGGAGGVWAILREGVKNEQYDEVVAWLANAFRLTPEQVLHEPTATEIESMVFLLVKAGCVSGLGGSFGSRDAWVEYVSQLGL